MMRGFKGLLLAALIVIAGSRLIHSGVYGATVFVAIPICIGALGAWFVKVETWWCGVGAGAFANLIAMLGLFALGKEGLICIAMAIPLALPLGALGGALMYVAMRRRMAPPAGAMLALMPLGTIPFDLHTKPPEFEVRSSIVIAAPPERVWEHVVTFADLPDPDEFLFRAGLAYPKRARIEGNGPGAIRYCEFSTGPFVEPIEVWDAPRRLAFRVTENPAPMHEWSPYANVVPRHLHGYLKSHRGQFRLTPLPGGKTLLEGTTWYEHGLQPAQYWRWWSDAVIHRIHMRVLHHIRNLAQASS